MSAAPPPPATPYQGPTQLSPADEKLWATLVHLGGLLWMVSLPVIPALVGFLVLRDRGPFVRANTAAALNFQISMIIYAIVSSLLIIVVIGWFLLPIVGIVNIVFSIIAGVKANQGQVYTYPLTIKFVS
ncbi:DUF4870 domain-containing protein [Microterricola pindariensis]|uniref:DUF4870 domain-containing protein n=1 Tax=Microterricola pindariensis TaxID=478010 RepID=A0ABX5AUY9_9MICO|nr:DUF4870 domain-containing protein [Microterricola pindariensis]PPL18677.1 hypothetical protein GY24_10035 [Microterricola pindariensis]